MQASNTSMVFQEMCANAIFVSTTALFPGHPQILSHSWVVFVCLFLFVCFFPQLWDTRSGLATRLASCHPSCAQLYQNVSDILPPARAALLHNSQTSVHNNIAPVPLLSDLFCPTLNLIAPGETCAKVQFILIQERAWEILFRNCLLFSVQSSSHKIVVSNPISCQLYQFIMFHILRLHAAMW